MTPIDQLARDRVTKDGLGETLFVGAGAGTGKTSTLVDRIIHLVTDERVSLTNLAAITFTEAAASELRDRVRRALEVASESSDLFVAQRCRDALVEFDSAAITTLHGFALRLLKEHPIEVQIPPRLAVLDPVQSKLAADQRWADSVHEWQTNPEFEALVNRLWSVGIELRRPHGPSLRDVAAILGDNWDRLEVLERLADRNLAPLDQGPLKDRIGRVLALRSECLDHDDTMFTHIATLAPQFEALLECTSDDDLLQVLKGKKSWARNRAGRQNQWSDVAVIRQALADANDAADALMATAIDQILKVWLDILCDVTIEAAAHRRDSAELEFHDLLVLARRLLRSSEPARRAAHQRYTRLLLDEFQDTDPIQIELAMRIAAAPTDQPADWRDLEPLPGRLFVVGDPKQSIYRFRRADIALYLETGASFGDQAAVALTQNFRTVEPVISWVNELFDRLMDEQTVSQPRYVRLDAARSPNPGADHRVVLFGPAHPDDPKAAELRHREAADVAALIAAIANDPASRPVWADDDDGDPCWRPARFGDMCILLPARSSLPMLEQALTDAEIPYRLDTSTLVFDSPEIHELLSVLAAVDDPADSLSIVAALRSPILACNDAMLWQWRQLDGHWDYRQPAPATAPAAMVEAMGALAAWHAASQWCEPAVLLERVVRERNVLALGLANRRPRDAWRRVRFLIDQARQFADVDGGHLRAFVRWVEMQRHEGSRVPEPLLPETDDDAVRIMTLHGAKGLEFPIVFLSGMTSQPTGNRGGPQIHWHADDRPELGFGANKTTSYFNVLNDFEGEMDIDERIRLLYVGATRARDHLFVSTHRRAKDDRTDRTYASRIRHTSGQLAAGTWIDAGELHPHRSAASRPARHIPAGGAPAGMGSPEQPTAVPVDVDDWQRRRDALLAAGRDVRRAWSATAIAGAINAAAPDPPPREDPAEREGDQPPAHRGGTAFGRAVHAVAQFAGSSTDAALGALAVRAAAEESLPPAAGADVQAAARRLLALPTVSRALASPRHWREVPVCAPAVGSTDPGGARSALGGAPLLVEGFIDLLAEIDGELVVIDYKTDFVPPGSIAAHAARYRTQLGAYAVAVESASGLRVSRAVLAFCSPTSAAEYEIRDLTEAAQRVVRFLAERP